MNIERQPNMHDLSWFIDMDRQDRLDLNPPYQRLSVWTPKDRIYFLDTIFNNFPCPAVYVQKEITGAGPRYSVVDGKQRLTTILGFFKNRIRLPANFSIPRLAGMRFRDLPSDAVAAFYNYVFLVETLRAGGQVDWAEVFFRVNKNQKTLTDQELRHARYDGWLITRAEEEAREDRNGLWNQLKISSRARSRRMKDVEFISVLMLVVLEQDFVGFPQANLNQLYARYDFNLAELPRDDVEREDDDNGKIIADAVDGADAANPLADDILIADMTRTDVRTFEERFSQIVDFIKGMDAEGAVGRHLQRATTDLYSLWAVLALSDVVDTINVDAVAKRYDQFLTAVDALYDRQGIRSPGDDERAYLYYQGSVGAATTVPARRSRHDALLSFIRDGDEG